MRSPADWWKGVVSKEHPPPIPEGRAGQLLTVLPTVTGGRLGFASPSTHPPVLPGEDVLGHALENRVSREDTPGLYHALKARNDFHLFT